MNTLTPVLHPNTAPRSLMVLILVATTFVATPAFAQIAKVNSTLSLVQMILLGIGATMFTIATLIVAYKILFQHAKWIEVSNIFVGGCVFGGAPALAAAIVG